MTEELTAEQIARRAKPCPFCAEHLQVHSDHHGEWVAHREETGPCIDSVTQLHDAEDLAAWNARTPPSDATEGREALAKAVRARRSTIDAAVSTYPEPQRARARHFIERDAVVGVPLLALESILAAPSDAPTGGEE